MYEFTSTTLWNDKVYKKVVADADNKQVEIFRQGVYKNDATHHICLYVTKGHDAYLDALDIQSIKSLDTTANYRLALYINSIGNADPLFSNDFVHKGRPVFVEFSSKQQDDFIKVLVNNLNKYLNVTFDHQILLPSEEATVSEDPNVSTTTPADIKTPANPEDTKYIVCSNEYMRISKAVLEKYNEDHDRWDLEMDLKDDGKVYTGAEGFGTYDHLEKDYRLPTAANLRWKAPMADERPMAGVIYDQITIHYTVHRGHVGGMGAVGQQVTSETTHIFWVPNTLTEEFLKPFTEDSVLELPLAEGTTKKDVTTYTTADYAHVPVQKAKED